MSLMAYPFLMGEQVSNQQASGNYLKSVKRSHFISSDKVHNLETLLYYMRYL